VKKIVGVSLGSSKRDHEVDVEMFGEKYNIKRLGTDGDVNKAINIIESLDGNVDAIGLGGIDYNGTQNLDTKKTPTTW